MNVQAPNDPCRDDLPTVPPRDRGRFGDEFSNILDAELREGVLRTRTKLGWVAACHLSPVHNSSSAVLQAHRYLFSQTDIVLGDMNAHHVHMHDSFGATCKCVHMPSYLPSCENASAMTPPAFDMCVYKVPKLSATLAPKQVTRLQKIKGCPRDAIASRGLSSDHVSVEFLVDFHGTVARCATWNVADPEYYSHTFPSALAGFDLEKEGERQRQVVQQIVTLLSRNDIVALQEVPRAIASEVDGEAMSVGFESRKYLLQPTPGVALQCLLLALLVRGCFCREE